MERKREVPRWVVGSWWEEEEGRKSPRKSLDATTTRKTRRKGSLLDPTARMNELSTVQGGRAL